MKKNKKSTSQNVTPEIESTTIPPVTDQFDLDALRLSQNFADSLGVKKMLLTVPVRKPNRQDFFRVRPEPEYSLETVIIELKEERSNYLVARSLWNDIPGEIVPKFCLLPLTGKGFSPFGR